MKSIYHRLLIEASAEKVYSALTTREGLSGWWTPETTAIPEVGSIARFAFGPDYFKEMEIRELKPFSSVQWHCIRAFEDWIGTTLTFELQPHKKAPCCFFIMTDGRSILPNLPPVVTIGRCFSGVSGFFVKPVKGFLIPTSTGNVFPKCNQYPVSGLLTGF